MAIHVTPLPSVADLNSTPARVVLAEVDSIDSSASGYYWVPTFEPFENGLVDDEEWRFDLSKNARNFAKLKTLVSQPQLIEGPIIAYLNPACHDEPLEVAWIARRNGDPITDRQINAALINELVHGEDMGKIIQRDVCREPNGNDAIVVVCRRVHSIRVKSALGAFAAFM
jgi:hypothetical protein